MSLRAPPKVERTLFLAFAFAVFAATLAALGARALDRVATGDQDRRSNYAIVRVLAPEGQAAMEAAHGALIRAPQVRTAAIITPRRAAALLETLGGGPVSDESLQALRLIELELAPIPPGADVDGDLAAVMAQHGVTGEVLRAPAARGGWAKQAQGAANWGAGVFALLMAAVVALSARAYVGRRGDLIQDMADLGAPRGYAAGRVADEAAVSGFWAGVAGAAAALAAMLIIAQLVAPGLNPLAALAHLAPIDLAPLAAAPLFAAVAAGMGARAAAESAYDRAARLG